MKHVNVSLFVPHLGCPHDCIFCNQRTISGKSEPLSFESVRSACETAKKYEHDIADSEIAFFGGSFTAIGIERMTEYLEAAAPYVGKDFGGIRVSTRPDCIDEEILGILKKYGVTAIELGSQSMSDEVLSLNERGHCAEDTVNASRLIKSFGFSLGLQMMTGLYGSDDRKDIETAEKFIELSPDTVRIYPTVVLEGTKLEKLYKEGFYKPQTVEEAASLCAVLIPMFNENNIKIIRVGLHSGGGVENGYVAGAYHPAFRELCDALIYRCKCEEKLASLPKGKYTVYVSEKDVSKMNGQRKSNTEYFRSKGYEIKVRPSPELKEYETSITKGII